MPSKKTGNATANKKRCDEKWGRGNESKHTAVSTTDNNIATQSKTIDVTHNDEKKIVTDSTAMEKAIVATHHASLYGLNQQLDPSLKTLTEKESEDFGDEWVMVQDTSDAFDCKA